jgi:phenylacetate-CoA ligase
MRSRKDWQALLQVENAFRDLQGRIQSGEITDYRQIPPESFSLHGWDLVSEGEQFQMVLPFLRGLLYRAAKTMPDLYAAGLSGIDPGDINQLEDWWQVPVLVKDDNPQAGLRGFREAATADPSILKPYDLGTAAMAFGSGGSMGRHTPTFVTLQDRAREIQGWRRGHDYHGLVPGDVALYTYNTTHKGGQWMQESLWAHGVEVLLRRPEEGPLAVLENIRSYRVNALFTVQQPYDILQNQAKAGGINLHSLVMASLEHPEYEGLLVPDHDGRQQIQFLFLGGFEIVPYALELVERYLNRLPTATLLGSSEAIPQAASTNPYLTPTGYCHANHLHLLQGPHFVEVVRKQGTHWVSVEKGEQGWLVYSSWARDGTLWVRYAPGDLAVLEYAAGECPCGLSSPVISGVRRSNPEQRRALFDYGCAAG